MDKRIKKTYICKDINDYIIDDSVSQNYQPEAGDVGVFEIIKIGKHKAIQSEIRRDTVIVPGDYIMAAFGNRYATEQFEGYVPKRCTGNLHILGAGGIIGYVHSMHYNYIDIGPTIIRMVGMVKEPFGKIINTKVLKHHKLASFTGESASTTKIILSLGSSMDSGKTTTSGYFISGLKKAGNKVAYLKLTGTAYTKDCDFNYDLGADITADFSDFGFPSTYLCNEPELFDLYESLLLKVIPFRPDYTLVEIADGLYQPETKMLLANYRFKEMVYGVLFSASDSLAAVKGDSILSGLGLAPFALSGLFTASPLMIEEVRGNSATPVLSMEELSDKGVEQLHRNAGKPVVANG